MKYNELDDRAKQRARDWFREAQCDHGWWEYVYSDAVTCSQRLGIYIGTRGSAKETDIWFSGFYTQGSGCCYNGYLRFNQMADAVEKMKEHAPQDEELLRLAQLAESIYGRHTAIKVSQRLLGTDEELNDGLNIIGNDRHWSTKIDTDYLKDAEQPLEDDLNTFVSGFADWIYKQLEAEYKHLTSDETCEEGIRANDYDFDEEGRV